MSLLLLIHPPFLLIPVEDLLASSCITFWEGAELFWQVKDLTVCQLTVCRGAISIGSSFLGQFPVVYEDHNGHKGQDSSNLILAA